MKNQGIVLFLPIIIILPFLVGAAQEESILNSRHNLSVSGTGDIKSMTETRVCIFCHSTHNSSPEGPLWNHETSSTAKFTLYQRETLSGTPQLPNGSSKLCLSCHDGTIAVGAVRTSMRIIPMKGVGAAGEIPQNRKSNLGSDLSGTHPVSIRYEEDVALRSKNLRWPPLEKDGEVGTDADGYVQCTTCHDPHGSRSEKYPFWRKETFSQVCQVCHEY